jgi:hypothetical protein
MPVADVFCVFAEEAAAGLLAFLPFVSVKEGGRRFFEVGLAIAGASLFTGHAIRALAGGYSSPDGLRLATLALSVGAFVLLLAAVKVLRGPGFARASTVIGAAALFALGALVPETIALDRGSPVATPAHALGIASALAGAALLGSVTLAMTLGHFYLVIPRLSIDPLRRLTNGYLAAILVRLAIAGATTALAWSVVVKGDRPILLEQVTVLLPRALFGLLGPLVLCFLARGTVAIKSTQSATGILYGATVFVVFGELAACWLQVEAGLPL